MSVVEETEMTEVSCCGVRQTGYHFHHKGEHMELIMTKTKTNGFVAGR